ncbi:MAG: hypothetical protein LBV69_11650, partial [Bacteroidales bacterium]|nr:hypothetical protein [Bacteroidales bacterium]
MRYQGIREEELKNNVAEDFFKNYDSTKIIGNIDFTISIPRAKHLPEQEEISLLWAEAKANKHDIYAMFAQLILT